MTSHFRNGVPKCEMGICVGAAQRMRLMRLEPHQLIGDALLHYYLLMYYVAGNYQPILSSLIHFHLHINEILMS